MSLGLPHGAKSEGDVTLPNALEVAPRSVQYKWVEVYLLNRGLKQTDKDSIVVKEERSHAYREELAMFFEQLGGGTVTVSEYAVTLSAETARNLGFGRDGPYRAST
ncbi:hypothetical protein [Halarchaeum grantii]|uniref:hypothetical protein n=1 Tax=Halarchaeum grantii TaxID=1193105 RepID=UPI00166C8D57|nr:hypothetical protein [Halarchaeum grantii]